MTEQEIETVLDEMVEMFGWIPNAERQPRQFAYYVKLYKYLKNK